MDQLRWIFSSYTEAELEASGWDASSVANSDGDDATHLWSELSADCPEAEIKIAGPDSESGTYEYMSETIFADLDNGEIFDAARPDTYFNSDVDEAIVAYLEANADAIACTYSRHLQCFGTFTGDLASTDFGCAFFAFPIIRHGLRLLQ